MTQVLAPVVLYALEEFSSIEMQRRLWLSDGSSGEVSSFTEAICHLFDDSALGHALDAAEPGMSSTVVTNIREIERLCQKIDSQRHPAEIIADPLMARVRELASDTLKLLEQGTP